MREFLEKKLEENIKDPTKIFYAFSFFILGLPCGVLYYVYVDHALPFLKMKYTLLAVLASSLLIWKYLLKRYKNTPDMHPSLLGLLLVFLPGPVGGFVLGFGIAYIFSGIRS